ncbi:MAG: DUF1801 domain-containing protein [Acidobacteria bacterium]|nr:DUF1801 domain-containing protein [Acidobacteriota bacterium]
MKPKPARPRSPLPALSSSGSVDVFLANLDHPRKPEILALRQLILSVDPAIGEAIKWNAPSFFITEHFATMNLRARGGLGVILHFGAKKNAISETGVSIPDPHSLLEWLAKDRALVTFRDLEHIEAERLAFTHLLQEWIRHL